MKYWNFIRKYALGLLAFFLVIPMIIQFHWEPFYQFAKLMTPGNHGDWLQFWGSYFGFIPTGLITFMVLEFQFRRQEKIDARNDIAQLKRQRQQFLFEREFDDLEDKIKMVDEMTKGFLVISNSFSRYDITTNEFSKNVFNGFQDGLYAISRQNMSLETWARGYFTDENSSEIKLIEDLKKRISALNRQRDGIQRKNYFNEHPKIIVNDDFKQFIPYDVTDLSKSSIKLTEQLRSDLFKKLQSLKKNSISA
ncbi:hypothetical protein EFE27_04115 [Leuconostoc citreum]|uniref:hypothetical protein n=1 Tax=Leuconostoc citreum TaxID=33964 RepID=UPI0021824492|nr:hypothetical protein [Leuconostoc citreum]MCS8595179.1 hypothetical protein [Leuconostoc citreum]